MNNEIYIEGKKYISAKRASEITNYSKYDIGELCKEEKISHRIVDKLLYVSEDTLLQHDGVFKKEGSDIKNYIPIKKTPTLFFYFSKIWILSLLFTLVVSGLISLNKDDFKHTSKIISNLPGHAYYGLEAISNLYAKNLGNVYINFGSNLLSEVGEFNKEPKSYLNDTLEIAVLFCSKEINSKVHYSNAKLSQIKFNGKAFISNSREILKDSNNLAFFMQYPIVALTIKSIEEVSFKTYYEVNNLFK